MLSDALRVLEKDNKIYFKGRKNYAKAKRGNRKDRFAQQNTVPKHTVSAVQLVDGVPFADDLHKVLVFVSAE